MSQPEPSSCRYKYTDDDKNCPHPLFQEGYCIFHLPKLSGEEKKKLISGSKEERKNLEIEETFRKAFFTKLREWDKTEQVKEFDFNGFQFPDIDLSRAKLLNELGHADFKKPVHFSEVKFQSVTFSQANIQKRADFNKANFHRKADFTNAIFRETAVFSEANFQAATFSGTSFRWKAEFAAANFRETVDFTQANFQKMAEFNESKFQTANFIGANFQTANFGGAKFQSANFSEAKFQMADFIWAKFQTADFNCAEFHSADFRWSKFQTADFSWAKVEGKLQFSGEGSAGCFSEVSDFSNLRFEGEGKIIFTKTYLGGASFRGTDLTRIEFNDIKWGRKSIFRKKILADELRADNPEKFLRGYQSIYDNYHLLVKIYTEKREFEAAEDFHVGEMEVRRKKIWAEASPRWRWLRSIFNSFLVYKLLSNYGTSYWQALIVLCLMLLAVAWVFLISGFQAISSGQLAIYNYDIFTWPLNNLQIIPWSDIKEAISFTLSILPFQRGQEYAPLGLCTEILKVAAVLVFSSQFALVLLAVRRRFKR